MTPVLTFFNNKGGVGKTSLVYHLAWMYADMGECVVVADLDPQANLTAAFLPEEDIEQIWDEAAVGTTIFSCVKPLAGVGDIAEPVLKSISPRLYFLPGDVALSGFEDALSSEWPDSMGEKNLYRPMRMLSAFWQVMQMAADQVMANMILVDIGPHLGAINRSALIATDYVVTPLGADLFSLQGLKNLGPTLREWSRLWKKRRENWNECKEAKEYPDFGLPEGKMQPIGYICQQVGVRLDRPVKAYEKWANRIPSIYCKEVLGHDEKRKNLLIPSTPAVDPYCLGTIKHYRSLIPLGQEHHKPIFKLTPADGAMGSQANAARSAYDDFCMLAKRIEKQREKLNQKTKLKLKYLGPPPS